jgi:hypothetical protein
MTKVANTTSQRKFIARVVILINWSHIQFESLIPDCLCTVHRVRLERFNQLLALQKVAHFSLAERVVVPLLEVVNWREKRAYLEMGGTMLCLVGYWFSVNAHLANAVRNKFETNATDTDKEKIIKDNLRRAYMVMFHGSHENESCLSKLYDVTSGEGNKFVMLRALFKSVLLRLGLDVTIQRQQRIGQRHSIFVVGSPEKILACALCVQQQQIRQMLTQVLPILLSTNNISKMISFGFVMVSKCSKRLVVN